MKYFPFLRGRQTEFLILRNLARDISKNGSVVPIIEPETLTPGRTTSSIIRSILRFRGERMTFLLICNPRYGELSEEIKPVLRSCENWIPAFNVDRNTTIEEYEEFKKSYFPRKIAIIYFGNPKESVLNQIKKTDIEYHVFLEKVGVPRNYKESIPKENRVYVREAFNRRHRNKEYPRGTEFFYTQEHKRRQSGRNKLRRFLYCRKPSPASEGRWVG